MLIFARLLFSQAVSEFSQDREYVFVVSHPCPSGSCSAMEAQYELHISTNFGRPFTWHTARFPLMVTETTSFRQVSDRHAR